MDELLLAGNYFGVQPYHGRFGSFGGALIESGGSVTDMYVASRLIAM